MVGSYSLYLVSHVRLPGRIRKKQDPLWYDNCYEECTHHQIASTLYSETFLLSSCSPMPPLSKFVDFIKLFEGKYEASWCCSCIDEAWTYTSIPKKQTNKKSMCLFYTEFCNIYAQFHLPSFGRCVTITQLCPQTVIPGNYALIKDTGWRW